MKNKTVRVIIILVGLLVLNIEAAQAGITHKFKVLIGNELSNFQLFYVTGGVLTLSLLSYIIFAPALKGKQSSIGNYNHFADYSTNNYQNKRVRIRRIAEILKNPESVNQPQP
jgi:hypothetical protein